MPILRPPRKRYSPRVSNRSCATGRLSDYGVFRRTRAGMPLTSPVKGQLGQSIMKSISELPHLDKALFEEGEKIIWHAQFN